MAKLVSFLLFLFICLLGVAQDMQPVIQFEGLSKIKESYLNRAFTLSDKKSLDDDFLERQVGFLERMPAISNAHYQIRKNTGGDTITYIIEESWTLLPDFNFQNAGGQTTFRLGFQEFNFLGQGIVLKAAYQSNGKSSYFVETEIPYLIGNFGIKGTFNKIKSDEPYYISETEKTVYEKDALILEALVTWNININHKVEMGAGRLLEDFTYLTNTMDAMEVDYPISLGFEKYSFKSKYAFNTITYDYYELSGWKNEMEFLKVFDQDFPFEYNQWVNNLSYFMPYKKGNLAFRFQTALATNSDSPLAPFTVDSQLNFRGVGDRMERGTGTIVINTEYRYPVYDKKLFASQLVAFADYGYLRMPGKEFSFKPQDSRLHVGIGARFILKKAFNSVLRIDYGWGLDRFKQKGLVIGLGQFF